MSSFAKNSEEVDKIQQPNIDEKNHSLCRPIWQVIVELGEQIPDLVTIASTTVLMKPDL